MRATTSPKPPKRSLIPKGGNDRVYTPRPLAQAIVAHFNPSGAILEPCRGTGAFWREGWDWCEIDQGRDFFDINPPYPPAHWDWVITNPPWSQFRRFLGRSMALSDNVVFLAPVNHFWLKARMRDIREAGFGFKEILLVDTPAKPWPQSGFQLGAVHLQRGHTGAIALNKL